MFIHENRIETDGWLGGPDHHSLWHNRLVWPYTARDCLIATQQRSLEMTLASMVHRFKRRTQEQQVYLPNVIFVNENENGEKRENNEFVNENYN